MQVKETVLEVWQSWKDKHLEQIHRLEKCDFEIICGNMLVEGGKDRGKKANYSYDWLDRNKNKVWGD